MSATLRSVMDDAEYDRERQRLLDLYGAADANHVEVVAKRDQAYAALFHRSGWTQDRLAEKEGKSQQWVAYRLRFGRFMAFSPDTTAVVNTQNLTEWRFRGYWDRTDKNEVNENVRFRACLRLMEADVSMQRSRAPKGLGPQIMEQFADGEWHRFDTLLNHLDCSEEDLELTLRWMEQRGTHKSKVETKPYGASKAYRIMRRDRMISSHELATKLSPLLDALDEEGRKTMARMSPPAVARLTSLIRGLLKEWSE